MLIDKQLLKARKQTFQSLVYVLLQVTQETLISLAKAISYVENGSDFTKYVTDKDYQDAMDILGINLPKKKVKYQR